MKTRRTSWSTLFVLLFDTLLLGLTSVLSDGMATLALLLALVHFYLVMHECVHGAVFVEHHYNEWLGHVLGFLIGCPFLTRRRAHALHHAWTGHPERDTTNARAIQRLSSLSQRQLAVLDVLWRTYVPVLSFNERVGLLLAPFTREARGAERRAAHLYVAGYAAVIAYLSWSGQLRTLLLYAIAWALSLVMEEMINLPHHLHAPFTNRRLTLSEQGSVTHSCAQLPFWSRWVLLNFGLHEAHHRWPALPWSDLPAAHAALLRAGQPSIVSNELTWSFVQRRQPFVVALRQYIRT